jgi:hypothetical protein
MADGQHQTWRGPEDAFGDTADQRVCHDAGSVRAGHDEIDRLLSCAGDNGRAGPFRGDQHQSDRDRQLIVVDDQIVEGLSCGVLYPLRQLRHRDAYASAPQKTVGTVPTTCTTCNVDLKCARARCSPSAFLNLGTGIQVVCVYAGVSIVDVNVPHPAPC